MAPAQRSSLQLPAFLYGPESRILPAVEDEGLRCAEQYRKQGSPSLPAEWGEIPPGEVLITRAVVDFWREPPAWRLYPVSRLVACFHENLPREDIRAASEQLERLYQGTPWGALHFMLEYSLPMSAERVARCLAALLRFWEPLESVRYLYSSPSAALSLEEMMTERCDWVLTAWSPGEGGSLRTRLERAAWRMAQASREECVEAILRQLPRAVAFSPNLKHREALSNPSFWRQRLAAMDAASFTDVSAAYTHDVLVQLSQWDKQLDAQ